MSETAARNERLALAAGVAYGLAQVAFVIVFGAVIVPHMPAVSAPLDEHLAFYREQHGALAVVNYLALLTIPLFLVFLGGIFSLVRRAEGETGVLTVTAIGSAVALIAISASGVAVAHAGQMAVAKGLGGAEVYAMDSTAQLAVGLSGFPRAVLVLTVALAMRGAGQMSLVALGFGLAIAALALLGTLDFVAVELFAPAALATVLSAAWFAAIAAGHFNSSRATRRVQLATA